MVEIFADMPTKEFLALLVKSKAAGASTALPSVGVESGPEVASRSLVACTTVTGVGASETTLVKEREKKRHRDGHSSKGHVSKKLKEPLSCPSSFKVDLPFEGIGELSPRDHSRAGASDVNAGGGLHVCKSLVDKLSLELERLMKLDDVVDPSEVKILRDEVKHLKEKNKKLERSSDDLAKDNKVSADKLFAALTEKSELITECDGLSEQVKYLKINIQELNEVVAASEKNLAKGEETWVAEKADLVGKLDSLSAQLSKCQAEALSSFEEGYGESVARLARFGFDVKDHGFDAYVGDLEKKNEDGKTGSSEAVQAA